MKQKYFKSLLIAMLVLFGSGGALADTYELYSGAITEGDYLLVYDNCAMNTTVSNSRLQFQAVQIVDNKITSGTADFSTIVWTITKSGDYYALYNASAGKYAASTGTKNQAGLLDSGTDDKSLWTITGSGTYEFVNKYNDAHNINKNLRKNGTYGFACYATGTGGSLLLYKKVTSVSPLSSIAVEGYKSTFHKGDSFEFGGTVTATYEDGTTNDVTNRATFTGYDMNTVGEQTVTVSYTEGKITMTVTYKITVTAPGEENPNNSFAVEEDNATIGEPYTMPEFTTSSDGAKSYSSSNTDVATISSNGLITLKKAGTTEITVSTAQTATYAQGSASYILHVEKGTPVLSFAQETVTAYLGTDQNGPELNNPSKIAVTYEISNPDIATIQSNGYIQPKATGTATVTVTPADPDAWNPVQASYTLEVKAAFSVDAIGTYELVTKASKLKDGDQVIISYIPSNGASGYVLGAKQSNNFKATLLDTPALSEDKRTFEITSTFLNSSNNPVVTAAILEGSEGAWYFHTNDGYLYATGSNKNNYLRTTQTINDNAKATISIADNGNAAVVFQGSNDNKYLKYNSQSSLFSCYGSSSSQTPVQLYRKIILPKVSISFAESVVEITYGDNYNKQAATTEAASSDLVYTSSEESIVKFHGNNVIDILGPGTVTITATVPATETTSVSSATYTLKVYAPADASKALNEDFSKCDGTNISFGGSSGFKDVPDNLGWTTTNCEAGPGYLKLGTSDSAGSATSPAFSVAGEAPLSFDLAPWVANDDTENAKVYVTLTNATFANGESTMTLSTGNLTQKKFTTFDQYMIKGNSNAVTITFSGEGSYNRFFLDNVIVGGGAHEINLTFGSAGYLTWVATADIDFEATEGVTAYKITEATPKKITMVEVDKVPEGAAVMLKGSGTKTLKRTTEEVADLSDNKMLPCTKVSVTGITGSATSTDIYVLGNGNKGLGFYMLSGTLQAGKGYLNISGGAGAKPSFVAFEETTGISNAAVETTEDDGTYYNLQGVRVMNPQKGIYIKNGKKIVIK